MDVIEELHQSLDQRRTPEAIAALILQAIGDHLTTDQVRVLGRAAGSWAARYSWMSEDFERPVPAEHKVRVLVALLDNDQVDEDTIGRVAGDPWMLLGQLRMLAPFVGWHPGADFRSRLNREQRHHAGVDMSRRKHNRVVRHMLRTTDRARRQQKQVLLRQLTLVGRSGLAYSITLDEMRADPFAACFVAYWVAQRNRRREFTLSPGHSPFDEIAQILFQVCAAQPVTDWWMLARAYPNPIVVARLDDLRQGELAGRWLGFMRLACDILRELYEAWPDRVTEPIIPDEMWADRPGLMPSRAYRGGRTDKVVDLQTMTVRQGIDSSTWNTVAQAYNAARAGWINCLGAAGALDLLEVMCPGKVMRLMAGDLVAMHARNGGRPDPDTRVWAALPRPWDVLDGQGPPCDAFVVEYQCQREGVDPHAKGWTAPRQNGEVAQWRPTPELVHGIEVADPLWAALLRKAGWYSGKGLKAGAGPLSGAYAAEQGSGGAQ